MLESSAGGIRGAPSSLMTSPSDPRREFAEPVTL